MLDCKSYCNSSRVALNCIPFAVEVPASADTNPAQPSLKELVRKRSKVAELQGSLDNPPVGSPGAATRR
jgi:hypothetical protein